MEGQERAWEIAEEGKEDVEKQRAAATCGRSTAAQHAAAHESDEQCCVWTAVLGGGTRSEAAPLVSE